MKTRFLPIAALGLTAVLGLTACSSGSDDAGANNGDVNAEGQTLDVWIMEGTNPDSEAFFDEVGEAFTEETGAELNVEYVQWADAHDRFVTSIAGGTTPDVAETGTTWTAEFADAGALAPIGEYVDGADLGDDLVEGLVTSGTYDDELYGMPWYAGVRSLVYRSDIFEELGLEAPTSWDEIVAAGEAIKAAHPEMMAFAVPGDAEFGVYPWVWGAGGDGLGAGGRRVGLGPCEPRVAGGHPVLHRPRAEARLLVGRCHDLEGDRRPRQLRAGQRRHGDSWAPGLPPRSSRRTPSSRASSPRPRSPARTAASPRRCSAARTSRCSSTADNTDLAWEFIKLMTDR